MENQLLDDDLMNNREGKSLSGLLANGYETHAVEYIKKGYELFRQNAGGFIGFLLLAFLVRMIAGVIPVIGGIISIFLIPLTVGVNIVAKKIDKHENYEFNNFLDGYKKLWPLIGNAFIQGLIVVAIMLVAFIPFFLTYGLDFFASLEDSPLDSRFITFIVIIVGLMIVFLFLMVGWMLSNLLIVFNNNTPWQAMETSRKIVSKKYFNWLGFILLMALVNIAGALCLLVGLLVTVPTTLCALYVAYEDVVGLNLQD